MGLTGPAASAETTLAIYTCLSPKSPNHQGQKPAYHRVWQPRFPVVICSRNGSVPAHPGAAAAPEGFKKHLAGLGWPLAQGDGDSLANSAESQGSHIGTVERKGD